MITRTDFAQIDFEVKQSIEQTLDFIKQSSFSDYILFLADGEFKDEKYYETAKLNQYVIDETSDRIMDQTRMVFFTRFLSTFYSFPADQIALEDDEMRLHAELMIYSHIWESKPFLRKLYRLAHLSNSETYSWSVSVPDMGKHDFIRNDIRTTFEKSTNNISQIIKNGFHTSLRNAFAHSEYSFELEGVNKKIDLYNYNGGTWELREISLDDWSKRFVYSALLNYYLLILVQERRINLVKEFKTDTFTIKHPSKSGKIRDTEIFYREQYNSFHSKINK